MNKVVFGLILGAGLGTLDGLSALLSAPEVAAEIVGIVVGSTIKGVITGAAVGWFARRVDSLPLGIAFGFALGLFLAFLVALGNHYYWQVMIPGALVGTIVGYATQRFRSTAARA